MTACRLLLGNPDFRSAGTAGWFISPAPVRLLLQAQAMHARPTISAGPVPLALQAIAESSRHGQREYAASGTVLCFKNVVFCAARHVNRWNSPAGSPDSKRLFSNR
jgi:hypothetical protein